MNEKLPTTDFKTNSGSLRVIETIDDRNKKAPWEDLGGRPTIIGNILVRIRKKEVIGSKGEKLFLWQFGLFKSGDKDDSVKGGPAIHEKKEDALRDGISLARKEIWTSEEN